MRLLALVTAVATAALALTGAAAAGAAPAAQAVPARAAAAPSPAWGQTRPVPGLAALAGTGDDTVVNSVSCASAGNCAAGGLYEFGGSLMTRPFVASQVHGTWGKAIEVPGLSALGPDSKAAVTSVSCPSAGNCTAVGYYTFGFYPGGSIAKVSAFVVSQVKGTWGQARKVPGLAALNTGNDAELASVSCASAGNCTAGGTYGVPHGPGCCTPAAFVTSQVKGTWSSARKIAGSGGITSVSCPSAGNCAAVGGVVVSQVKGAWRTPRTLTGPGGRKASITTVSCAAAGNCSAGGVLLRNGTAVTAGEVRGAWGHVRVIPGVTSLLKGGQAVFTQVSCAAVGKCTAGGYVGKSVEEGSSTRQYATSWVVSQRRGTWGSAQRIPGVGTLSKNGYAIVTAVSCSAPGDCVAAAAYSTSSYNPDGSGPGQAFVASQVGGTWRSARQLSSPTSTEGPTVVSSVACPATGKCTGGGYFWPGGFRQAFVVSQAH